MTLLGLRRIAPKISVSVIPDGEEALEKLIGSQRLRPQVILLDLKLPKVHGLDILAALKADQQARETPVIIFTSSEHPIDVSRAMELGCSEYVCKPIDVEEYMHIVCDKTAGYLNGNECLSDR
jgi:CheY-like chemotaxis protein